MRRIWYVVMLASLIALCIINPENSINAMMDAGEKAVMLSIKLIGVYAIWLGILGIVDQTKLSDKISSLLSPIIDFLFGKNLDQQTKNYISMNLSTNILGMGNACTPLGIKAMNGLDKLNNHSTTASTAMIMLMVINATSIQLLPTTIIGLRASYGSTTSSDIIIPSIIATTLTTVLGVLLVKLCSKIKFKKKVRKV